MPLSAYFNGSVRCFSSLLAVLLILCLGQFAAAANLASSGQLNVPADARLMVISTDFAMQQVLSEDFAVARRGKGAAVRPSMITLTVSVIQRVLEPTVSMISVAPGVPNVEQLLKTAGYRPPVEQTGEALTGDAAAYMAQGNPSVAAYRGYQSSPSNPMANQFERMSPYAAGPPPPPDPRDPRNRPVPPPDYLQPKASEIYDTAVIAHAVLSDGKGEMTVVAVAQPNEDLHAVKKQLAERIANAVLH